MTNKSRKINLEQLPIAAVIILLPLVTRMTIRKVGLEGLPWLPYEMESRADFFLYWKGRILIIIAAIMLVILLDAIVIRGKKIAGIKVWIPLLVYEGLAVLSTIFSNNRAYSLHGMMEHYESIWVLLSYGVIAFYTYTVLQEEKDFQKVSLYLMISALLQGILGIFQLAGHDLLAAGWMKELMIPEKYDAWKEELLFNFSQDAYQRVSGTLYNSNYAGTFFAMVLAVSMVHAAGQRGYKRIFAAIVMGVSLVCLIGTGSKSGAIAFLAALVVMSVREAGKNPKYLWYGVLGGGLFVLSFVCYDFLTGQHTLERIGHAFESSREEDALQDILVEKDWIKVRIRGREISLSYDEVGVALYLQALDEQGNPLNVISDEKTQTYTLAGEEFDGIVIQCYRKDEIPYLAITYGEIRFLFTNWTEDGSYTYITIWGKPDQIMQAEAVGLKGKERLFTYRGYIWARTIPLLKKHILLGSGPDTFMLEFPQNDYVMRANMGKGFFTEILTKPHCMYLQIAVQTGVLSLVAFFVLLGIYFAKEWKALKRVGKNPAGKKAASDTVADRDCCSKEVDMAKTAILFSLLIYGMTGITNDSMLVTAPLFWVLLGAGLKLNAGKDV